MLVNTNIGDDYMIINDLIKKNNITRYRLAMDAGIPHATLSDICNGKTNFLKCSSEMVYKLAKVLDVTMELLTESTMIEI